MEIFLRSTRFRCVLAAAVLPGLSTVNLAAGQGRDWTEFASREDRFTCNFLGTPAVGTTTWTSEYGAVLPARVYSAIHGQSWYSMMVVADGYPEPGLFQQSLGWLDEAGNGIRYQAIYLHGAPPPPVNSRGGQGGFGRINAPGASLAQDPPSPQGGQAR